MNEFDSDFPDLIQPCFWLKIRTQVLDFANAIPNEVALVTVTDGTPKREGPITGLSSGHLLMAPLRGESTTYELIPINRMFWFWRPEQEEGQEKHLTFSFSSFFPASFLASSSCLHPHLLFGAPVLQMEGTSPASSWLLGIWISVPHSFSENALPLGRFQVAHFY